MLGVVLWSDRPGVRAVIWCEDHGQLAYFDRRSDPPGGARDVRAGDLVQFKVVRSGALRKAKRLSVLPGARFDDVPAALKSSWTGSADAPKAPSGAAAHIRRVI